MPRFHLAFPVVDLESTRDFYVEVLGCRQGRRTDEWIDLDFHGHQLSAHRVMRMTPQPTNNVDGQQVPVCHFGLVLEVEAWKRLRDRLVGAGVAFLIGPGLRFAGEPGEQWTMFVSDPSGNGLEFKAFTDPNGVFR